jgi:UDP-glucose 4-epimerase
VKAAVVGGSGFIGGYVVSGLLEGGHEVTVLDQRPQMRSHSACGPQGKEPDYLIASLDDQKALRRAFDGATDVYHFAGKLGTSELDDDRVLGVQANIIGTINVLDAALACGVTRVFIPCKPNIWLNSYSITKHAAEQYAELYRRTYDIQVLCLRYFNVFGPGQALAPIRKVIPTFAIHALRNLPLPIYGDGTQTVDMIYAPDIAALTLQFMQTRYDGTTLDGGGGAVMTVGQLAAAVNCHFHSSAGVRHLPMRRGETPGSSLRADPTELLQVIGGFTYSDWTTALADTLSWYAGRSSTDIDAALAFYRAK